MTTHLVLVVDDEPDFSATIGDGLRDRGYEVAIAASAPQALEMASRQKPSICVLDVAMPGVDGIQLLRYFRSRHVFRQLPVIIMSAGVGQVAVKAALQLGVKDVMLKSKFTIDDLAARIESRLAGPADLIRGPGMGAAIRTGGDGQASAFPVEWSAPEGSTESHSEPRATAAGGSAAGRRTSPRPSTPTPEMILAIGRMRALPKIVSELLRLSALADASLSDLEGVVRSDPVVAARLLHAANSAAFLRGRPTTQLDEAVRVLGFTNVAKIASQGTVLTEEDMGGSLGIDLQSIWRHSLAAATYSERMASPPDRAAAYLGGLLHDLPSLFALQYLGSDWAPWRSTALTKGMVLHEALSEALGCPLESIAEQILSAYRIPEEVSVPIQEYHEFFLARRPREPGSAARRLDFAHHFAVASGRIGTELSSVRCLLAEELGPNQAVDILQASDAGGFDLRELESGLGEPEESEIPAIGSHVVLWRDPRWAAPDPLECILGRSCDCLRVDKLEELAMTGYLRLAIAEPGSAEWERLGAIAPVLVLHRGPLPDRGLAPGVEDVRMPVSVAHLVGRLRQGKIHT